MLGLTKPSPMSSTPPPAGSTGTTTAGSTAPSEWSRPPNTSKPTTLPSTRRSSPHENGTKAVTLHDHPPPQRPTTPHRRRPNPRPNPNPDADQRPRHPHHPRHHRPDHPRTNPQPGRRLPSPRSNQTPTDPAMRVRGVRYVLRHHMAVAEGFEPSEAFTSRAFEARSLGRSDTPPPVRLPKAPGRERIAWLTRSSLWPPTWRA